VHATTHRFVEGREVRYFTFLRDPATLALSQYNHEASRLDDLPEFWDWYADRPPDPQLRWCNHRLGTVGYDEVVAALEGFWFVGTTETLDKNLPRIFKAIGVPTQWINRRVTDGGDDLADVWPPIEDVPITRHQVLTDEIRDRVREDDLQDARLHRYARRRGKELRRSYGWRRRGTENQESAE